ncbi:MAG: electron transfer flavoprotein [Candidatus Nitrosocaldus sp.]
MDRFDAVIVGGGSAGLAALMELSKLGIQAVLLESGKPIGSKNVTGGILYSKSYPNGKVYNVEDIYPDFFEAPVERRITHYYLNALSGSKVYTVDLTEAHEYRTNFAYSVLMARLNKWFAERADEEAAKLGGGIIEGVHVRDIVWADDGRSNSIIVTDELEEFGAGAIIAADGVNSEVALISNARGKFEPEALYQGVKCIVRVPEDIIDERFNLADGEGVAHLFAGDISRGHNGGGFLYTNRDTLSVGLVYHLDSLLKSPIEPYNLLNEFLTIPVITNYIVDEVAVPKELDRALPKEEQLRIRFGLSRLLKQYEELRYTYYSKHARLDAIRQGLYSSEEEIKTRLEEVRSKLEREYGVTFANNYVEVEYSCKLVPDGKRAMMDRPYKNNILFIGDAAGKGIFLGTRIEGINIGIDDAARAARAVARAKEMNNFSEDYMGRYYAQLVEESPYTDDIRRIDFEYMKIFVRACRNIPLEPFPLFLRLAFMLIQKTVVQELASVIARMMDQSTLLKIIESNDAYVKIPMEVAERVGSEVKPIAEIRPLSIDERIARLKIREDEVPHIRVRDPRSKFVKAMVHLCPTKCYIMEASEEVSKREGANTEARLKAVVSNVILQHEGCIECGTCSRETEWRHTRGEKGIMYEYG